MTRRLWPVVFVAAAAAGVAAAWLDLAELRARLHDLGGRPTPPPPRRVGLARPFDWEKDYLYQRLADADPDYAATKAAQERRLANPEWVAWIEQMMVEADRRNPR